MTLLEKSRSLSKLLKQATIEMERATNWYVKDDERREALNRMRGYLSEIQTQSAIALMQSGKEQDDA